MPKDSIAAFPQGEQTSVPWDNGNGMSLRDYFAGQALAGICTLGGIEHTVLASHAYALADAMLIERAKD